MLLFRPQKPEKGPRKVMREPFSVAKVSRINVSRHADAMHIPSLVSEIEIIVTVFFETHQLRYQHHVSYRRNRDVKKDLTKNEALYQVGNAVLASTDC